MSLLRRRAGAVALGLVLDRVLREPPTRWHPVAWFGTAMGHVERRIWADARRPGVVYAAGGVTLAAASAAVAGLTAPVITVCVAGNELRRVARRIEERLRLDDLAGARALLPSLVGRDPSELDHSQIAAAVVESLAENSVDAVIAPLWWGVLAGAPGAAAYRAVNTMDAMVGHHNERYEHFGWAAARTDDVANYVPARVFALLVALAQPHTAIELMKAVRRDAPAHPSPNAGVAESAVAAALGVELGGPLRYGSRLEERPRLGVGPRPGASDIDAAITLTSRVEWVAALSLVLICLPRLRRKKSRRSPSLPNSCARRRPRPESSRRGPDRR